MSDTCAHGSSWDGVGPNPCVQCAVVHVRDAFASPSSDATRTLSWAADMVVRGDLWGVWVMPDRVWCPGTIGSWGHARSALLRWASGEAAEVDPARFVYEVRRVTSAEAEFSLRNATALRGEILSACGADREKDDPLTAVRGLVEKLKDAQYWRERHCNDAALCGEQAQASWLAMREVERRRGLSESRGRAYEKALRFYADPDTWRVPMQSEMADAEDEPTSDAKTDGGLRAREALSATTDEAADLTAHVLDVLTAGMCELHAAQARALSFGSFVAREKDAGCVHCALARAERAEKALWDYMDAFSDADEENSRERSNAHHAAIAVLAQAGKKK